MMSNPNQKKAGIPKLTVEEEQDIVEEEEEDYLMDVVEEMQIEDYKERQIDVVFCLLH